MFQTSPFPLSTIKSFFLLYTQQRYMSYSFADSLQQFRPDPTRKLSANLCDIYHCCLYSEKTPDNGQTDCPKHVEFYSKKVNLRR